MKSGLKPGKTKPAPKNEAYMDMPLFILIIYKPAYIGSWTAYPS